MEWFQGFGTVAWVGFAGLGVLLAGWLAVSFTTPGPRRVRLEWLATCGMYLALLMLFLNLTLRARDAESTAAALAFGFLALLFTAGLCVSCVQTLLSFRAENRRQDVRATN